MRSTLLLSWPSAQLRLLDTNVLPQFLSGLVTSTILGTDSGVLREHRASQESKPLAQRIALLGEVGAMVVDRR